MSDYLTVSSGSFEQGLRLASEAAMAAARKAMTEAMLDLERRAKQATPVDQGTLQRSIHARVNEIEVTPDKIEGIVATGAEASDYAIKQHEDVLQHKHPRQGSYAAKYMETPLKEMTKTYAAAIAADVRAAL